MTTGAGREDRDPAGAPVPTRVSVAGRSWLVPGLVIAVALAVALVGFFGDKVVPRPPSPSESPSATALPDAISFAWSEVPIEPATFADAVVGLVVSGPRGVLALGQGRTDRHPIAWRSRDGLTWVRADLAPATFGGGVPDAAVQLSSGWVAVGYHATADGTSRDVWTSPDGVAWARDPSATGRGFEQISALTGSGQTAVMVATVAGGSQMLLSSHDGQVWAQTPDLDATLGRNSTVVDAVASASGIVAVGYSGSERSVWRSADGRDWARSPVLDASVPPEANLEHVFRTAEGLLITGSADRFNRRSSSWVSSDGLAWTTNSISEERLSGVDAVFALDGGNLGVVGGRFDLGNAFAWTAAGLSDAVAAPTPQLFDWTRQAAVVDGHLLVVAEETQGGPIGAWIGNLMVVRPAAAASATEEPAPSGSPEPSSVVLPPIGRPAGSSPDLDWSILRSSTVLSQDAGDLVLSGIEHLGSGLIAYGSDGYNTRFWLSTDKSHWRLLELSPAMRGAQVYGLETLHGAIVAVGQVFDANGGSPAAWTSPDGQSWKRLNVPRGDGGAGQLSDVVAGPEGLVAVGWRDDGGQNRGAILTSPDGSTWTPAPAFDDGDSSTQFNAVAHGAAGYVAVGTSQGGDPGSPGMAWTSPDGRIWTRAGAGLGPPPGSDPSLGGLFVGINDVVAGDAIPGGPVFVAVGSFQSRSSSGGAIFSSLDGRTWSRAPDDPALDSIDFVSVVEWAGGLAAAGNVYAGGRSHPVIWMTRDGASWAPMEDADLTHVRSGDLNNAFVSDLASEGSGLVAVGGAFAAFAPVGAVVWAGAGPAEIVADHVCPGVIDTPARLASMTGADRAACIGDVPVTLRALARADNNDCTEPDRPPDLSECGGSLYLAAIGGGADVLRISIDPSLIEVFGNAAQTPWKLTLRTDVIGPACDPVPARNGVVYEPPEAVHLQCRALLRLVAQEPIRAP